MSRRCSNTIASLLFVAASPSALACTASTTPVAFGSVDPVARMPTDSAGTITVSCPTETTYTVAISSGNGAVNDRHMSSGANRLNYQLFTDASLAVIWGDGTAGTVTVNGTAGPSSQTSHQVYGRVPAQPFARMGAYADTLTITVTF